MTERYVVFVGPPGVARRYVRARLRAGAEWTPHVHMGIHLSRKDAEALARCFPGAGVYDSTKVPRDRRTYESP